MCTGSHYITFFTVTVFVKETKNDLCSAKKGKKKGGLNASAKGISSDQHAQTAQADLDRNVLLQVFFLHVRGRIYPMI